MATNGNGFPIETCTRCHGTGEHSYNQITGTICFKCGGAKFTIVKRAKPAWDAFVANADALRNTSTSKLVVGVAYRAWNSKAKPKVVTAVEKTDEPCGSSKTGNADWLVHCYSIVTFEDGTKVKASYYDGWKRLVTLADLNADFYLAQIPKAKKVK